MLLKLSKYTAILVILNSSLTHAQNCEIPIKELKVGSITVLQNLQSFKKIHENIEVEKDRINVLGGTDYSFALEGVMYVTHVDYDSLNDRVIGFSLTYANGKYGSFDTPIHVFKENVLSGGNLPKNNWVLTRTDGIQAYRYSCNDYKIFINQDPERSGPTLNLFSRYSDSF